MRFPSALLGLLAILTVPLHAGDLPTIKAPIPDVTSTINGTIAPVDLRNYFEVTGITGQVVQFTTVIGTFNTEMLAASAPNTVANFLNYVNGSRLANTIVHRSDNPLGIIQGGSIHTDANANLSYVATDPPIPLETTDTLANVPGTIAMARQTSPDTATCGWFINTSSSLGVLPPASSGGYAVFGRVTGTGMTVVDAIAALAVPTTPVSVTSSSTFSNVVSVSAVPANLTVGCVLLGSTIASIGPGNSASLNAAADQNISTPTTVEASRFFSPLNQLPIIGTLGASYAFANLANVSSVSAIPVFPSQPGQTSVVSFSILSNSNPSIVTASVSGSTLNLTLKNVVGFSDLVINATDTNGNSVQSQFRVNATAADKRTVGTWVEQTVLRNLPAAAGRTVDIGAFTFSGNTGSIEVAVNAAGTGWSVAKRYVIPMSLNLSGTSPSATWLKVLPTHDTGPYVANNFDLDVNVTGGTASLRLRTVASAGGSPVARICVKTAGLTTFVNSTATATVTAPTLTVGSNAVNELAGKAGIGIAPSANASLDVNGGSSRGLRLRPRTTAGAPTSGTWSDGTIIMDSQGNLYICKVAGTPGTWKKVGGP